MSCQYLQGLGQLSIKLGTLIIKFDESYFHPETYDQIKINNSHSVNQPSKNILGRYSGNHTDVSHELHCTKQVSFTL